MSRIKNTVKRHPFETRPDSTEEELLTRHAELQSLQAKAYQSYLSYNAEKQSVKDRLRKIRGERSKPKATDHALLRYLERVEGVNLVETEDKLEALVPLEVTNGDIEVNLAGKELRLIVRENHIVTIRDKGDNNGSN